MARRDRRTSEGSQFSSALSSSDYSEDNWEPALEDPEDHHARADEFRHGASSRRSSGSADQDTSRNSSKEEPDEDEEVVLTKAELKIAQKREQLGLKPVKPTRSEKAGSSFILENRKALWRSRQRWYDSRMFSMASVDSAEFIGFMTAVTVFNIIMIGVEVDTTSPIVISVTEAINNALLLTYITELCFRFMQGGTRACRDPLMQLDLLIILVGSLERPLFGSMGSRAVPTLRLFRVLKFVRYLKYFSSDKYLQFTMQCTFVLLRLTFWLGVLLSLVAWLFGVVTVFVIGYSHKFYNEVSPQNDPRSWVLVRDDKFGSAPDALLTMFQLASLSEWANAIVRPIVDGYPVTLAFFGFFLFGTAYGLVLTVAPVFVNEVLTNDHMQERLKQAKDREARDRIGDEIMELVTAIDEDNDGQLSAAELDNALMNPVIREDMVKVGVPEWMDGTAIVCMLDKSGDGLISYEEFRDRIVEMEDPITQRDWVQISQTVRFLMKRVELLSKRFEVCVETTSAVRATFQRTIDAMCIWEETRDYEGMLRALKWEARYGTPNLPDPPKEVVALLASRNRPATPSYCPEAMNMVPRLMPALYDRNHVKRLQQQRAERQAKVDKQLYVPGYVEDAEADEDDDGQLSPHEPPVRRPGLGPPSVGPPDLVDATGRKLRLTATEREREEEATHYRKMIFDRVEETNAKKEVASSLSMPGYAERFNRRGSRRSSVATSLGRW